MCAAYIFMDVDFRLEDNDFPGATLCKKKILLSFSQQL